MQNYGHYAVQGHLRSLIFVPIENLYSMQLLVNNINLRLIFHRFQVIYFY